MRDQEGVRELNSAHEREREREPFEGDLNMGRAPQSVNPKGHFTHETEGPSPLHCKGRLTRGPKSQSC